MQKQKIIYTITGEMPLGSLEDFRTAAEELASAEENLRGFGTANVEFEVRLDADTKPAEEA